jgi:hypothetical protein
VYLLVLLAVLLIALSVVFPRLLSSASSATNAPTAKQHVMSEKLPDDVPWFKVGNRDFDANVLHSNLPTLVYFDTAVECRTVDDAFLKLRRQREGTLVQYYVDADKYPALARAYGVGDEVKLVLFDHGRPIRSVEAKDVNGRIQANEGFGTVEQINESWYRQLVRFVDQVE